MAGSDQKINYSLRPAKSIERKMMCDLIRGIQVLSQASSLRYIGMGAKFFEDFLVFHNEFDIKEMVSIEERSDLKTRYEFNKPLKNIEMYYGKTTSVLPQLDGLEDKTNFIWLDYDALFSEDMVRDVMILVRKLSKGSMFFLSCNYSFAGATREEKMESFKDRIPTFFNDKEEKGNYTNNKLPIVIKNIIDNKIGDTLKIRNAKDHGNPLVYRQLMFLTYRDGAPMLTIGGILTDRGFDQRIKKTISQSNYCFVRWNDEKEPFNIRIPSLTQKEVRHILQKIPLTQEQYEREKEDFFGITYQEIEWFEQIHRYYPYFVEGRIRS
jgi:hypothetical protein